MLTELKSYGNILLGHSVTYYCWNVAWFYGTWLFDIFPIIFRSDVIRWSFTLFNIILNLSDEDILLRWHSCICCWLGEKCLQSLWFACFYMCCGCWKVIGSYIYRAKFPCAVMFCISVKIFWLFVLWCFTECFINRLVSRVQLKVTHI